ncbi:MAG: hypothetical protein GY862_05435 [Gammaproteobacteria bacterium]|nr:hypothetical protein [Gammaproteobacteria bacterium]
MKALRNAAVALTVIMLSGCATMSDSDKTKAQGAGVGAVLGAAIGYAVGGKKGAALGAAMGAGVGFIAGFDIAKRKEKYASKEQAIAEETEWNRKFVQEVQAANRDLRASIQTQKQEIAALKSSKASHQKKQTALRRQKTSLAKKIKSSDQKLAAVRGELAESEQRYKEYKVSANSAEMKQWRNELAKLEKERDALQGNIQTLNAMNNSLGI